MIDLKFAMGFFLFGSGIIVFAGALMIYFLEKGKKKKK